MTAETVTCDNCYHCGLPVPPGSSFAASIAGVRRPMCCAGCEAVAQAIADAGLDDYYRNREALPENPRELVPQALRDKELFEHAAVRAAFQREVGEHECEATLSLEGITCAACIWLNERHLARQNGVRSVDINYTTHRARVRWDERETSLAGILAAVAAIGYRAQPYDASRSENRAVAERRRALWRLAVAGLGMMQVMMYAVPAYLADAGSMSADIEALMRWASLALTLPVVLYSAGPFFRGAWRDLRMRRVGMDVPVALGIGAAFAASVQATLTGGGAVYYDSVTMFVFFLLGGRYLEMLARHRALRGIDIAARAIPVFALRLPAHPSLDGERIAAADLVVGDYVLVKPGETIPADGRVIDGRSSVDESLLTGESRALAKEAGSEVTGGSVNVGSPLVVEVLKVGEQTRLAAIQRLIDRAGAEKPPLLRLADRVASWFLAAVLALAAASYAIWLSVDPSQALWVFVSVLVVSCPCALSLAAPATLSIATGAMARRGLLVARGRAVESLARVTRIVFDKTGTLTEGKPRVVECWPEGACEAVELRKYAAALEQGSEHPLAAALRADIDLAGLSLVQGLHSRSGAGVEGRIDGRLMRLGSPGFVAELHGRPLPQRVRERLSAAGSIVALGDVDGWMGFFNLSDALRPDALAAVAALRAADTRLCILSGDAPEAVKRVAALLDIADVEGGLSPEAKHRRLKQMQEAGEIVAMVGDGVNDAPGLAQAQLSIAMDGGADLARVHADIILLGGCLSALPAGLALARRSLAVMRQNLVWACAYNLTAIPLAMAGWVTPWMAGIGMSASSLLVVLNALRLAKSPSPQPGEGLGARAGFRGAQFRAARAGEPCRSEPQRGGFHALPTAAPSPAPAGHPCSRGERGG